jgi:uncharacterized protein with PQ loop repeat
MNLVTILGWVAAAVGILLGLPQLIHLIRTRHTEGVSLIAWQTLLLLNLMWAVHGVLIGQWNMITTNVFALFTTVPILVLMCRHRGLSLAKVLLPSVLGALVVVGIDLGFGAAAYGVAALIPGTMVNAAQSVELIRSRSIVGVSPVFLVGAVANQVLWGSWALLVPEVGTIIAASLAAVITLFNLIWWVARRLGVRAFFPYPEPELVGELAEG